ncbi:MAG TPA: four helix bundle protein [Gemmatimonadaceae bacterium]|nr:four helix bundle protein [Gemmatimonadaceae bacterium]
MTDFKKLKVWEKAHEVAVQTHMVAKGMRPHLYSPLQNQIVRAAASVPTNIAEGSRQASRRDFARFLRYALNSNTELEYHFILARDIDAIPRSAAVNLLSSVEQVRKMLYGLLRRVSPPNRKKPPDPECQ